MGKLYCSGLLRTYEVYYAELTSQEIMIVLSMFSLIVMADTPLTRSVRATKTGKLDLVIRNESKGMLSHY